MQEARKETNKLKNTHPERNEDGGKAWPGAEGAARRRAPTAEGAG